MRYFVLILGATANCCISTRHENYSSDGIPNENYAVKYKDFSSEIYKSRFKTEIAIKYKVGDRFLTRKQMFLVYSVSGAACLMEPGDYQVPTIDKYLQNPDVYRYGSVNRHGVIKLIPVGTMIEIVKIAMYDYDPSPIPYFVFSGQWDWFLSAAFDARSYGKDSQGNKIIIDSHNNRLFRKL